jgi:hypothetical protein
MHGLMIQRKFNGPVIRNAHGMHTGVSGLGDSRPALHLAQTTDFAEFFGAVLAHLGSACWLLDDVMFSLPDSGEEEFEAQFLAIREPLSLAGPELPSLFGRYIVDNWCSLVGLAHVPAYPWEFLAQLRNSPRPRELADFEPSVTAAFYCVDGQRWDVFSEQVEVISTIRRDLTGRRDLVVIDQTVDGCTACTT